MIEFITENFSSILLVVGLLVIFFWLIGFLSFVIIVLRGFFIVVKVILGVIRFVLSSIVSLLR